MAVGGIGTFPRPLMSRSLVIPMATHDGTVKLEPLDLRDADNFADTLGRLEIDHAFAAAVGEAVFIGGGALAESVFGDRQDQVAFYGFVESLGLTRGRSFLRSRRRCPTTSR